jgi:hypothetical protein
MSLSYTTPVDGSRATVAPARKRRARSCTNLVPLTLRVLASAAHACHRAHTPYCDQKVANRDTKVWHGATEKGP